MEQLLKNSCVLGNRTDKYSKVLFDYKVAGSSLAHRISVFNCQQMMSVPMFVRLPESTQLPFSTCGHTGRVYFPECLETLI